MNNAKLPCAPVMAIFGVGLIGGSLAMDLKKTGSVSRVIGVGRSRANLDKALEKGVIDEVAQSVGDAVNSADIIVLATPVNTINDLFAQIQPHMNAGKVITDVGSVKSGVIESARARLGSYFCRFVPGHPVAGREKSGIDAAVDGLFENHKVILTPADQTDKDAVDLVHRLWQDTGALLSYMDPVVHDRVLTVTSHLPHMLAYVMMNFLARSEARPG